MSFGGDGKVADDVTGQARSVALQADGKIVIAGFTGVSSDFVVARYNTDGTIDTSFSGDGYTVTNFLVNRRSQQYEDTT